MKKFFGKKTLDFSSLKRINFNEKLKVTLESKEELTNSLIMMLKIRFIENKLAQMRKEGFIGGPVHLGAGQEAIAVGVSKYLRKTDRIFSGHRSHAHL